jgi:hypothetical protein
LLRPNFNILIGGGALGSDETGHGCNLIPGREMLEATFGRVGQNMSITACAGGHVAWFLMFFLGLILGVGIVGSGSGLYWKYIYIVLIMG